MMVCNDCSQKDYEEARPWLSDPRITYLKTERNSGPNVARNLAIEAAFAQGADYLVMLDDEEELDPRCLEVAAEKIGQHPDVGWFLSNTFGDRKPSTRRIVREGYYDWIDDYSYAKTLHGDKTHVIATRVLREIRFDGRYRYNDLWPFYLSLAARTKIWGYPYDSKKIEYTDGGITKTTSRYPRTWLEVYSRFGRHAYAIKIRPTKFKAYISLIAQLAKTPKRAAYLLTGRVKPYPQPPVVNSRPSSPQSN